MGDAVRVLWENGVIISHNDPLLEKIDIDKIVYYAGQKYYPPDNPKNKKSGISGEKMDYN